jgi:hypothetical protein
MLSQEPQLLTFKHCAAHGVTGLVARPKMLAAAADAVEMGSNRASFMMANVMVSRDSVMPLKLARRGAKFSEICSRTEDRT